PMELKQYLKMTQQLVMTPQLQQAIKLLQLSRIELAETVQTELLENPVLEEHYDSGSGGFEESMTREVPSNEGLREEVTAATDSGRDKRDEIDWESFIENYNQYSYAPGSEGPIRY